jgi:hypothetical protein
MVGKFENLPPRRWGTVIDPGFGESTSPRLWSNSTQGCSLGGSCAPPKKFRSRLTNPGRFFNELMLFLFPRNVADMTAVR